MCADPTKLSEITTNMIKSRFILYFLKINLVFEYYNFVSEWT